MRDNTGAQGLFECVRCTKRPQIELEFSDKSLLAGPSRQQVERTKQEARDIIRTVHSHALNEHTYRHELTEAFQGQTSDARIPYRLERECFTLSEHVTHNSMVQQTLHTPPMREETIRKQKYIR